MRRFIVPLLLALLLPAAAQAQRSSRGRQPPDPAQAARELFAAADYAGAMAEFERVMAETGDENLRVEVARCLSRLDRPLDALAAFEAWLVFKGEALPEAERAAIEAEMQAEWAKVGRIRVRIDQDNVEIRLDGTPIGFSPLVTPMRVPAGPHVVEVFHPRYEDQRIEVDALPGEITEVPVTMHEPPPPPPPPPPPLPGQSPGEIAQREQERARQEQWNGGGWNPMPLVMPWTFAQSVPAGFVLSAAVGVGDLTATGIFDEEASGTEGPITLRRADPGLSLPMPAFVGYRLHAAPMFAVGGFFQYQFHDTPMTDDPRYASRSDGHTSSLFAGAKVRTYFPLGLLEPWIGVGAGYAQAEQTYRDDYGATQFTHTLEGAVVPLEVGLDFVPWDYITAGFSFLYGFGVWQEYCQQYSRDHSNVCVGPDDAEWPKSPPDLWTFDFHVNFYLR